MSIKAKSGIDLCNNQLLNAVLENKAVASAPENPVAGSLYWDTTNNCLKIYNGSAWVNYNPLDAYSFTKAADGVLQIMRYINSSTAPTVEGLTIVDTSKFDTAGAAAAAQAADSNITADKRKHSTSAVVLFTDHYLRIEFDEKILRFNSEV